MNNMQQPTNDQLFRIFGIHIGCEAIGIDSRNPEEAPAKGNVSKVGRYAIEIDDGNRCIYEFMPDEVKLLLTPLSHISYEDEKGIAKIATSWDENSPLSVDDVSEWLEEVFTGNCAMTADYVNGRQFQELLDFLRPRGYDCGYDNISSLIEAGIAVDKTSVK